MDARDADIQLQFCASCTGHRARHRYIKCLWRLALSLDLPAAVFEAFTCEMRRGSYVAAKALIWPHLPPAEPRPIFVMSFGQGFEWGTPQKGNTPVG